MTNAFFTKFQEIKKIYLGIFVDDMIIFFNDLNFLNDFKNKLFSTFPVKDLGEPEKMFGVRVTRDKKAGTWTLDQTEYVDEVLKRYEMYECNSFSVSII